MYAAIDIGTNTVLLLIAEIKDGKLYPIQQETRITRLGKGLTHSEMLSSSAIKKTFEALSEYVKICREKDVREIIAVGTASMRKARNSAEFAEMVLAELGVKIDIISEEKEAKLTYLASAQSFGSNITVLDIGGGSTELIISNADEALFVKSLKLGAVTITERFIHSYPTSDASIEDATLYIRDMLTNEVLKKTLQAKSEKFVAAAGTATTLAAIKNGIEPYDGSLVHGMKITIEDLEKLIEMLKRLTLEELRKVKGLQRGREDVILAGALILKEAMKALSQKTAIISDHGVRFGTLIERCLHK